MDLVISFADHKFEYWLLIDDCIKVLGYCENVNKEQQASHWGLDE